MTENTNGKQESEAERKVHELAKKASDKVKAKASHKALSFMLRFTMILKKEMPDQKYIAEKLIEKVTPLVLENNKEIAGEVLSIIVDDDFMKELENLKKNTKDDG